jgi:hypothetical protein
MRLRMSKVTLTALAAVALACGSETGTPNGSGGVGNGGSGMNPNTSAGSGGAKGGAAGVAGSAGAGGSSQTSAGNGGNATGGVSGGSSGGMQGNAGSTAGNGGTAGGSGGSGGSGMVPGETKPTVTAPASSKVSSDYFVLGETRLLNNNWGAQALNCNASYEIYVNADKTFGWKWDRNTNKCGGNLSKPDYPEVEFGMHPFGTSTHLITSPDYSSTTVLPIQIQDVTTASVKIEGLSITTTADAAWNMNFEMWFSTEHPATGTHTTAYGETMNWFGWSSDQYGWNGVLGTLDAGQNYELWHTDDTWPDGQAEQWKYRQFRLTNGGRQFDGTVDVKKILTYLTGQGWPASLWIARLEIGTELDDGSAGTVSIKKITFEVNGQERATEVH